VELGDYLPIQEAAKLYQVSDDTLYRLIAAGRLKRYRREGDRRTYLRRADLDSLFRFR
jgi:excisionase family DNA binding protein